MGKGIGFRVSGHREFMEKVIFEQNLDTRGKKKFRKGNRLLAAWQEDRTVQLDTWRRL